MLMPVKICLCILGAATPALMYLNKINNLDERGYYNNKKVDEDKNPSSLYRYFNGLSNTGKGKFFDYHLKLYDEYIKGNYNSYKITNGWLLKNLDKELELVIKNNYVAIQTKRHECIVIEKDKILCENRREMIEIDFKTILARREMLKERLNYSKKALKHQFSREGFIIGN